MTPGELLDLAVAAQCRANALMPGSGVDAKFIVIQRRKSPVRSERIRMAGPGSPMGRAHWSDVHREGGWKVCASFSSAETIGWLVNVIGLPAPGTEEVAK